VIFEVLIAYRRAADTSIGDVLVDALSKVLEDNFNDFEIGSVRDMIRFTHERVGGEREDDSGTRFRPAFLGFALNLPDDTSQMRSVVDEFVASVAETPPIFHAVKFEDPLLRADLIDRAREIVALEMNLRRVLTVIYLYANQEGEPYDLLSEETVQPMAKERPSPEQMRSAGENQFFHLTFGQYVSLNQRPEFKLPGLISCVRDSETFDAFRQELSRTPVEHEDDAVLLAGLKERMDAIETMRNCIAHNRRPSRRILDNYENARPLVDQMLDEFLAHWEVVTPANPIDGTNPEAGA
jgi:hypothetical protein